MGFSVVLGEGNWKSWEKSKNAVVLLLLAVFNESAHNVTRFLRCEVSKVGWEQLGRRHVFQRLGKLQKALRGTLRENGSYIGGKILFYSWFLTNSEKEI